MKKNKFTLSIAILILGFFSIGMANAQTSKIQIVHNSPDYIIDTVDVWANNVRIANNLVFRKSTGPLTIDSGDYVITISKSFSTDSSSLYSLAKIEGLHIDTSKSYLAFITGVVDTNMYAANPEGFDRSLTFITNEISASAGTGQIELSFFNGTPDASKWDVNEIGLPGLTKLADDISFNVITAGGVSFSAANIMLNITNADSSNILAAYRFNASGLSKIVGCVFSSGVMDTVSNPNSASLNKFYVVLNNGLVLPLVMLTSDIQIVHNSADVANVNLDVYINGVLAMDDMPFRSATAFLSQKALFACNIALAPSTSVSVADAFYTTSNVLDSFANYYFIAHGVSGTGYSANPDGRVISFDVTPYKNARKDALMSKNVDLLYFHGVTDLQATTCKAEGQVQYLSKDDFYGEVHGYAAHTALDNINVDLKDATTDSILYNGFMNLAAHQGQGGLVITSGFLDEAANQNGDSLMMFIIWADGDVDSIAPITPNTGINEKSISTSSIRVFPNPVNTQLEINLVALTQSILNVSIMNIMGEKVYANKGTTHIGNNSISVSVADLQAGIYFVNLSTESESITRKITIIR
jgi:hypothetical protein